MNSNLSKLMVAAMVSGLIAGVSTARAEDHAAGAAAAAGKTDAVAEKHTGPGEKKMEMHEHTGGHKDADKHEPKKK